MVAQIRAKAFVGRVQRTNPAATANLQATGFSGSITSGAAPVTGAARIRARGFSGIVTAGGGVTPSPARIRARGFSGKVAPRGASGKPSTGTFVAKGGQLVPAGLFQSKP